MSQYLDFINRQNVPEPQSFRDKTASPFPYFSTITGSLLGAGLGAVGGGALAYKLGQEENLNISNRGMRYRPEDRSKYVPLGAVLGAGLGALAGGYGGYKIAPRLGIEEALGAGYRVGTPGQAIGRGAMTGAGLGMTAGAFTGGLPGAIAGAGIGAGGGALAGTLGRALADRSYGSTPDTRRIALDDEMFGEYPRDLIAAYYGDLPYFDKTAAAGKLGMAARKFWTGAKMPYTLPRFNKTLARLGFKKRIGLGSLFRKADPSMKAGIATALAGAGLGALGGGTVGHLAGKYASAYNLPIDKTASGFPFLTTLGGAFLGAGTGMGLAAHHGRPKGLLVSRNELDKYRRNIGLATLAGAGLGGFAGYKLAPVARMEEAAVAPAMVGTYGDTVARGAVFGALTGNPIEGAAGHLLVRAAGEQYL